MNTDHKCLKIIHLFVTHSCTFFAIDDVTMTLVNTYTSMMGITLKIST